VQCRLAQTKIFEERRKNFLFLFFYADAAEKVQKKCKKMQKKFEDGQGGLGTVFVKMGKI
jgi:hypothetical protein